MVTFTISRENGRADPQSGVTPSISICRVTAPTRHVIKPTYTQLHDCKLLVTTCVINQVHALIIHSTALIDNISYLHLFTHPQPLTKTTNLSSPPQKTAFCKPPQISNSQSKTQWAAAPHPKNRMPGRK
jgi:hypothetical protein